LIYVVHTHRRAAILKKNSTWYTLDKMLLSKSIPLL
jgi:hypothetical protein